MKATDHYPVSSQGSKTVLYTVANTLAKGSTGRVISSNLKDIYSVLLINLDLKEKSQTSRKLGLFSLRAQHAYSFTVEDAIEKMAALRVEIPRTGLQTTFSYSIKPDLAHDMLRIFFEAKFLHCPTDRTRNAPKSGCLLQPTPKGVAVLQKFVRKNGLKKISFPPILRSNINSMETFVLERSVRSDKIYLSDSFVELLFIRCMGPSPNVWSPENYIDAIPESIIQRLDSSSNEEEDLFNFDSFSFHDIYADDEPLLDTTRQKLLKEKKPKLTIPPFTHKFFTNPDSDSHIQYYVSNKGLRLYENKKFDNGDTVQYSFTGKVLCQWLMDCCDILYHQEACLLGQFFMKNGLIQAIPGDSTSFIATRHQYYKLTERGNSLVCWGKQKEEIALTIQKVKNGITPKTTRLLKPLLVLPKSAPPLRKLKTSQNNVDPSYLKTVRSLDTISLLDILKDAGMRYLFRNHLESQYCEENFDCYHSLQAFKRDMRVLKELLSENQQVLSDNTYLRQVTADKTKMSKTVKSCIKQANDCLSNAYNIFGSYLAKGASYEVNIDYHLKMTIARVMCHPKSPIATTFQQANMPWHSNRKVGQLLDDSLYPGSPESHASNGDAKDDMFLSNVTLNKGVDTNPAAIGSYIDDETEVVKSPTLTQHNISIFDSPNEEVFGGTLFVLNRIYPLFDSVSKHLYQLMEKDSLAKFVESELFKDSNIVT